MKRPSFQFYPGDWTGNSNLKRCTHEEKGIWIDVLCVLHDQEEYGVARWPLKDIAEAAGSTVAKLRKLVAKGVLKGADAGEQCKAHIYVPRSGRKNGPAVELIAVQDGPLWFSSRMVEDEHKRLVRGGIDEASKEAPKDAPKDAPKGGIGAAPKDAPDPTLDQSPSRAGPSSPSSPTDENPSVEPGGSTGGSPPPPPPDPEKMTRDELWSAGKSLLSQGGMPEKQCGTFVGKLVKDYGAEIVVEAVRKSVLERPADPASFLKALCQRIAGERKAPNHQEALEAQNLATAKRWAEGAQA